MKRYIIPFTIILTIAWSCQSENQNKTLIIGQWEVDQWLVGMDKTEKQSLKATFNFEENGRYDIDYTTQKEAGKYRVSGNKLYTTEDGQLEKMVKITRLNTDTLEFEMNRGGQKEVLILVKQ